MKRYLLDANAWIDFLHRCPEVDDTFRVRVRCAADNAVIEIAIGEHIMEELLNEKFHEPDRPERFSEYLSHIVSITHNKILMPIPFRMGLEFIWGKDLAPEQCFFPYVNGIRGAFSLDGLETAPKEIAEGKRIFKTSHMNTYERVRNLALERTGNTNELDALVTNWKQNLDVSAGEWQDELVMKMSSESKGKKYRTQHSLLLFEIVKQQKLHTANPSNIRRISSICNLAYDEIHYIDARGCYCDFLVTQDSVLTEIAADIHSQINDSPVPISFKMFMEHINTVDWLPPRNNYGLAER
jgi:hypothetical protein